MALKLNLKPGEKLVINGAVIVNGDRKTSLAIRNFAHIMRESDVMQEEQANTPTRRAYFAAQLLLLDPEGRADYVPQARELITALKQAYTNPDVLIGLDKALGHLEGGDYYKSLAILRRVIRYEDLLLAGQAARTLPPLEEDTADDGR